MRLLGRSRAGRIIASLVAGGLVGFSLPPWGWFVLCFVGLTMFFLIGNLATTRQERFLLGFVFASTWFGLGMAWMWFLTAPGYLIAVVLFASLHGLATVIGAELEFSLISRPALHTLMEALRFSLPFGGVPLATLPIAVSATRLADIVSIGGPILATWFVLQSCGLLASVITEKRVSRSFVLVTFVLLFVQIGGQVVQTTRSTDESIKVAMIQGGGPQGILAINARARDSFDRHLEVTKALLASEGIEAVIWPENVIDVDSFVDSGEFTEIVAQAKRLNSYFVVGITESAGPSRFTNAQVVIDRNGKIISRYDKVRRVPFGEYIPAGLRTVLDAIGVPTDRIPNDAVQGSSPAILMIGSTRIGVVISWESFFAERARNGVLNRSSILINPTNGSSYTGTILQTQQLATNTLRARETGRWTLQVATTGFSAVIDPHGKIMNRIGIGEATANLATIPLRTGRTIYSRLGDAPIILLAIFILFSCIPIRPQR